ncbi:hypothetical protein [uncultured Pelagimonas sp.]|uniref:hypothetical protein n=1 Tax=uncultured Pelagimonas sp. TaxID=1618102 RepID=UPI0026033552|nr:hypothetical protein [uncultured Pelagimonas sp.]
MTVRYKYFPDEGFLLMKYFGRSTHAQQVELFSTVAQQYDVVPFMNCVSDMSELTQTTITSKNMMSQVTQITQALDALPHPIKQALYAPTPMSMGISRMYLGYADLSANLDIQVFHDLQEAINWAGKSGLANELFETSEWDEIPD